MCLMIKRIPKEIKEEILAKVKQGQKVLDLATQYGISNRTIYAWLSCLVAPPINLVKYNQLKRENEELKRIIGMIALDLEQEKKEKYLLASNNKRLLASLLNLPRKKIYYQGTLEIKDIALKKAINDLHKIHPAYGHKRVALALKWGKNRARRIMAKYGIKPPRRKGQKLWLTRSISSHHYTNLLKDLVANRPNQIFVSDLTYLPYQGKNVYLATVEDIFTREIVYAEISDKHDSSLALATIMGAINNGLDQKLPEIFHCDQGSEFMAEIVTGFLESKGIKISVSDKGSPWQNGYKESFFGRFKDESGDLNRFE